MANGQNKIYIRKIFVSRFFCNQLYSAVCPVSIIKIIIHYESMMNLLCSKVKAIFLQSM
jgi:hypothetical protein